MLTDDEPALECTIADDPTINARVVLMIGLGEDRDLGPEAESGVRSSLSKPIHLEALRTSVRVALGLQVAEVTATVATSAPTTAPARRGGHILLAEDNLINQKVAVAILTTAGYSVHTVSNGTAAVHAATTGTYDAILMDCQMPEMSGYEATAAIRAFESPGRRIPIIALTAGARREDRERCLAEGMDSYLAKPVSKDALLALLLRSISSAKASAGSSAASHTVPLPETRTAGDAAPALTIDPAVFGELRALGGPGNDDFAARVSEEFIHETGTLLVTLRDAFDVDDAFTAGRIAHRIAGGCSQLGGVRLAASCRRFETAAMTGSVMDALADLVAIEADYVALSGDLANELATEPPA